MDLIDRQAAIDRIEEHIRFGDELYPLTETDRILNYAFEVAASCVYNLPSAQERKKGKWTQTIKHHKDDEQEYDYIEIHCSVCGVRRKIGWRDANYCPNCGADMRGEEE